MTKRGNDGKPRETKQKQPNENEAKLSAGGESAVGGRFLFHSGNPETFQNLTRLKGRLAAPAALHCS